MNPQSSNNVVLVQPTWKQEDEPLKLVNYGFHMHPNITGQSIHIEACAIRIDPTSNPIDQASQTFGETLDKRSKFRDDSFNREIGEFRWCEDLCHYITNIEVAPVEFKLASITVIYKDIDIGLPIFLTALMRFVDNQHALGVRKKSENVKIDVIEECRFYHKLYCAERDSFQLAMIRTIPYSFVWKNEVADGDIVFQVRPENYSRAISQSNLSEFNERRFMEFFHEMIEEVNGEWNQRAEGAPLVKLVIMVIGDTKDVASLRQTPECMALERRALEQPEKFKVTWRVQREGEREQTTAYLAATHGWNTVSEFVDEHYDHIGEHLPPLRID